ncbi:MAG: hypothetical protein AB1424_16515 [Thermodesulfobacteriota bacterium]
MTMWFFDDAEELVDYQIFRKKDQPLLLEYEKLRRALQAAEVDLRDHPGDKEREARVAEIKEKIAALEERAPWLTFDYPVEYLLWGPPHG